MQEISVVYADLTQDFLYLCGAFYNSVLMLEQDEKWMREALQSAREAADLDEVPVGACLVDETGSLVAAASNRTISNNDPTAHAEILAMRLAAEKLENYRLTGLTMYATVEPCVMCAGALVNARVKRLVFGAHDERFGAAESVFRLCDSPQLNHRIEVVSGVFADQCREVMQAFFLARRG